MKTFLTSSCYLSLRKIFRIWGFCGPYFPVFALNTEIYSAKYGPNQTPYSDAFHAVFDFSKMHNQQINQICLLSDIFWHHLIAKIMLITPLLIDITLMLS